MSRTWHPKKPAAEKIRAVVPLSAADTRDSRLCICGQPCQDLRVWREHDERDLPIDREDALVYIAHDHPACMKRMKDHPRLYAEEMGKPGTFPICGPCRHRVDAACKHPKLKANGGPGVLVNLKWLVPPNVIICPPPKGPKARAANCEGLAAEPTSVIDWTSSDPARNQYGCLPCPKCKSVYRYGHKENGAHVICCDECGDRQPVGKEIS